MGLPKRISKAELARLLNKDVRSITNYQNDGMPVDREARPPKYDPIACVAWYVDHVRNGDGLNELDQMRARKALADARKAELEIEAMEERLIPLEIHEQRFAAVCERLAAQVKTIGRFRGEVQRAMTDLEAAELLDRIQDEQLRALMATSDEIEDWDDTDGARDTDAA